MAANESVMVFASINIVMGSIWGRRSWGIWWTWDARLTSSLILVLIYGALFGMVDVPLIYMSNRVFRTQHPGPVIGGGKESGLDPDMLFTFLFAHVATLLLWWSIVPSGSLIWLFAAFAVAWALVFGHLFRLSRKEVALGSRVAPLGTMLSKRP